LAHHQILEDTPDADLFRKTGPHNLQKFNKKSYNGSRENRHFVLAVSFEVALFLELECSYLPENYLDKCGLKYGLIID
jgi:hypothetical protein